MTLEKELGEKVKEGAFWGTSGAFLQEGLVFVFGMIMGHLISEADFGLFSTVNIYTNIGSILLQLGLPVALIQRKNLTDQHIKTAYTVMLGTGLALTSAMIALSPRMARFYGQPLLTPICIAASLILLFNAAYGVPNALLTRNFQFKRLTLISFTAVIVAGGTALAIAAQGHGVWGLVENAVGFPALICIPAIWLCGWRPHLGFDKSAFKDMATLGTTVMVSNLVLFLSQNADQLVLGKVLGFTFFGDYARAYGLIVLPLQKVSTLVDYVVFPAYAKIQDQAELLKAWYLKASLILAVITYPMIVGLAIIAPEFLPFYGAHWSGAVLPMRILSLATLVMTVHMMAGSILVAVGHARAYLACQIIRLVLMTTAAWVGSHWGLIGVCWAVCLGNLLYLLVAQAFITQLLQVTLWNVLRNLGPSLALTLIMAAVVSLSRLVTLQAFPAHARLSLVVALPVGVITYIAAIHLLPFREVQGIYADIIGQFRDKFKKR